MDSDFWKTMKNWHRIVVIDQGVPARFKWCIEKFGIHGDKWNHVEFSDDDNITTHYYFFKEKDDAIFFKLTWT